MDSKIQNFEDIIHSRIKYGRYEKTVIGILSLIFFVDGIEISALSLILPILVKEWDISENLQGLMGTMLFVGLFFGALFAGIFTDKYGRRTFILYVSITQFLMGIISALVTDVYIFILVRSLFGFLLGCQVPLVPTLCAELLPIEFRGKITVIINSIFSLGQFIAITMAYFCLNNLGSGNWRLFLLLCSFPSLVIWYLCYKYLMESPRYLILKMNISLGVEILNKMIKFNNEDNVKNNIFSIEKDGVLFKKWAESLYYNNNDDLQNENYVSNFLKSLFKKKYLRVTICLWISWFGINFIFYGLVFILPFFLNEWDKLNKIDNTAENAIIKLLVTTAGEGASGILAYILVETETFGRKYSLAMGQIVCSLGCLLAFKIPIEDEFFLVMTLTIARFFGKMSFAVIYPFTAEIYPTFLRTKGIGAAAAIGRLASSIMPIITIKVFYSNMYTPFLLFFAFGMFSVVGTLLIPYDTRGRHLDMLIS